MNPNGEQEISLERPGCLQVPIVQHEMLHVLGCQHEMTRADRDSHVDVIWNNILPGMCSVIIIERGQRAQGCCPYFSSSLLTVGLKQVGNECFS